MSKLKVGLIEQVKLVGTKKTVKVPGKFDTGARRTSIDVKLARKIGAKKIGKQKVSNVHGHSIRPIVDIKLEINGKKLRTQANVFNREHRTYKVLIGRDIIFSNFIIDLTKSHKSPDLSDLK